MRSFRWLPNEGLVLLLLALASSTSANPWHQRYNDPTKKSLPPSLHHQTRGGYANIRTKKPHRNWLGYTSGTANEAPTIPWTPWSLEESTEGGVPFLFPHHLDPFGEARQQERHHPQENPERLSYVDELKRQVAKTSEEAALRDATENSQNQDISRLDLTLFASYMSHAIAMTLPIVLLPLVAAEHVAVNSHFRLSAAAVVASMASIMTLGGGVGKILNGFVCQSLGGSRSSSLYLTAWAGAAFLLSTSAASQAGWILALMEFLASIQWTAMSLVLANHYGKRSPAKFARGITILSLASTSGTLLAKTGGTALLHYFDNSWRAVARVASVAALLGAATMRLVSEHPNNARVPRQSNNTPQATAIGDSLKAVLGNPLFWQVGIAHATAMVARTSDRILGSFFHQTTDLPRSVCGGLTAFVTIGFVRGLIRGRKFHTLKDIPSKTQMLSKAYSACALSAVGMALCANRWIQELLFPSKYILAATIAALSGILASNISFQFYQIPAMTATAFFGPNKALCLSLLDGLGFFLAAPVWAATGKIVEGAGPHGWTLAWFLLAGMFSAGGKTMIGALPMILKRQQQQQRAAAAA
ncbi:expressed unknown protein [Seminavis robusta]|uniref:Uncharacterized protein n=1 Tax=Seminavis robusta TaxID=568900 RepID=A0A9N8H4Y6_9STRA|nr:expressed unknown protein [Seminavis robusta]|eukprot:Sro15_g011120.1 n/a (587) ;mRNA; f:78419-80271